MTIRAFDDERYIVFGTNMETNKQTKVTMQPNTKEKAYYRAREMRRTPTNASVPKYKDVWILDTETKKKIWDGNRDH